MLPGPIKLYPEHVSNPPTGVAPESGVNVASPAQSNSAGRDLALPRITIVTPSRNSADYIAEAVESVVCQNYPAVEHLVLDACSTDGTSEILARYPHLDVVREPDDGSHDAMNKGLARASGDVIGFLNSDDFYSNGVLDAVAREFAVNPDVEMVAGHCIYFADDNDGRRHVKHVRTHEIEAGLWLPELMFGVVGINGCFFRRSFFTRIGNFDNSFDFGADRHLILRAAIAGTNYRWLDTPIVWYRIHNGSRAFSPDMPNLLPIGEEHFRMSEQLVQMTDIRPELRRAILAWRSFEGAKLLLRRSMRGEFADTWRIFRALVSRDPAWPLHLPRAYRMRRQTREQDERGMRNMSPQRDGLQPAFPN